MPAVTTTDAGVVVGVVAFTDVVGFTEFTAIQGDQEAVTLLEHHEALLERVMPPTARIVKNLGDGFLLWFPDAHYAVHALLDFQDHLAEGIDDDWPLEVRIGAHLGTPLRRGEDLLGHDVNVAARILDIAGPGEVLVSDAVLAEIDDDDVLEFVELGPISMKGIPDPVPLHLALRDS